MERLIEEFSLGDIGLQSVMPDYHRLDNLPVALYVTNAQGAIVYYNSAASKLWGRTPELYKEKWCGSYGIYTTEGKFLPHSECPMAVAIKENKAVRGVKAIASRPDGTHFSFMPFPTPIRDEKGQIVGGINMLIYAGEAMGAMLPQEIVC